MCSASAVSDTPPYHDVDSNELDVVPVRAYSVYAEGMEEAKRYKWILSQQQNRDVGESAIRHWVQLHWNGFLRARWLEHLHGTRFWSELDQNDFGLLRRKFQDSALLGPILDMLIRRKENFDVIQWALNSRLKGEEISMDEVLVILEALDINSRRLEFEVESHLTG